MNATLTATITNAAQFENMVSNIINKVSNIIIRHIDNRKLLLICILLLSHSLMFFRFLFYKNMVVIYVFYWKRLCILIVVYVFLSLSMYS